MTHIDRGDWIRNTRPAPVTLIDFATGGGIPAGSTGVVTDVKGSRITVDFDTGYGLATATIESRHCRLVRRAAGAAAFRVRARRRTLIRLGLALALSAPFLQFTITYWIQHGNLDGVIPALVTGALGSIVDWITLALTNPVQTAIYATVLAVITRFVQRR